MFKKQFTHIYKTFSDILKGIDQLIIAESMAQINNMGQALNHLDRDQVKALDHLLEGLNELDQILLSEPSK